MSWRRRWPFVALAALLFLASAVYLSMGWAPLEEYRLRAQPALAASFRTMAEHDAFMQDRSWPYVLHLEAPPAELLYFGSSHTSDPDDPQVGRIENLWEQFAPTVGVTENRLGYFVGTFRMGIRHFGEFGAVHALGFKSGVPVYTLEPAWKDEAADMSASFPREEVTLFYTLRVFLNERGAVSRDEVDALAAHLLRKRGSRPGLEGSLPTLADMDRLWRERFSDLGPWRELPPEAVHPSAHPTRLQAMANLANEVRDRHAVRVILELMRRGERVFAVAGGSHVVKQEPVLRAGLPASGDRLNHRVP